MKNGIPLKRLLVLVGIAFVMGIVGSFIQYMFPFLSWRVPASIL